jgi:hypothetical protein
LRLPHFQTFGSQMAARLLALRDSRPLPPGRFLVLISVRGWVGPRAIMRPEGLDQLKKSTSSGTRTGDFSVCSIVPQSTTLTTLPRAPASSSFNVNYDDEYCLTGVPPQLGQTYTSLHDVTSQKIFLLIVAAVRTSNLMPS